MDSTPSERIVVTQRDRLELRPWRVPAPADDQVRVRVDYSAVSFGDVMLRRQVFRPVPTVAVPGYEVIGVVEAVGAAVRAVRVGDPIAAFIEYGGNARHALVKSRDVVALPVGVAGATAAAAILNYATAFGMLAAGALEPGDDLVVHGAAGGVGTAVLDTARALGLRPFGTVRGGARRELGAPIFDTHSPRLVEEVRAASAGGVRAVFDPSAGRGLWRSRAMLRRGGSLIVFGLSSVARPGLAGALGTAGTLATLAAFKLLRSKRTAIFAIDKMYHREPERVRRLVERTLGALASSVITPVVATVLPLAKVDEAHRLLERGGVIGKIVIDCR